MDALLNCRLALLTAVVALSADHVAYLAAAREKGVPGGETVDTGFAPEAKSHSVQLTGLTGPKCQGEIFRAVDRAVEEGDLPRRIRVPVRRSFDWAGRTT